MKNLAILLGILSLTACQSLPKSTTSPTITKEEEQTSIHPTTKQNPLTTLDTKSIPKSFAITGKIGISTAGIDGRRAGSAFYAWGQENERFAIDLTGVLGIGATQIRYDGKTATISSEALGQMEADTPEELLLNTTGWQAPISLLSYWVMGEKTPSDTDTKVEAGRLVGAKNGDWAVILEYNRTDLPSKLVINHQEGHRVVMTVIR